MLVTFVIFVAAVVYGVIQFQDYSQVAKAIEEGKAESIQLNSAVDKYSEAYAEQKKAFDEDFITVLDSIEGVFPSEENYKAINFLLDEFQTENSTSLNPIFISNVSYGRAKIEEDYAILPFTLSFESSRDNFEKFLRFIFNSGSLSDQSRLMSIQAISIDFPQETSAFAGETSFQSESISVSIALFAYFQIPPEINNK